MAAKIMGKRGAIYGSVSTFQCEEQSFTHDSQGTLVAAVPPVDGPAVESRDVGNEDEEA